MLQKVVEVLFQKFKDEASVILVLKAFVRPDEIELVRILLTQPRKDVHLNLTLASVGRVIFQDLDGDHFVGALFPTFDHLNEPKFVKRSTFIRL